MTHSDDLSNLPALPIPPGAVAGDWYDMGGCGHPDDISRSLTWSLHDVSPRSGGRFSTPITQTSPRR